MTDALFHSIIGFLVSLNILFVTYLDYTIKLKLHTVTLIDAYVKSEREPSNQAIGWIFIYMGNFNFLSLKNPSLKNVSSPDKQKILLEDVQRYNLPAPGIIVRILGIASLTSTIGMGIVTTILLMNHFL